jgi:hypothetical protein
VVFLEAGVHGPLRLTDVGGCTWVACLSGARDVVHHGQFVGVGDGVLEVDELGAEGVLIARDDTNVSLAEGSSDYLGCAAVVGE